MTAVQSVAPVSAAVALNATHPAGGAGAGPVPERRSDGRVDGVELMREARRDTMTMLERQRQHSVLRSRGKFCTRVMKLKRGQG